MKIIDYAALEQVSHTCNGDAFTGESKPLSIKVHRPLSEALPFWFAMTSPVIGIVLGLVGAWIVGR